jgi:aerobic-type carbon monoxide dehydrogenase small subunit (CoxS/CutS family)
MAKLRIQVNGRYHAVTATPDTPLLYVLRNDLHLHGPRFGGGQPGRACRRRRRCTVSRVSALSSQFAQRVSP